VRRPAGFAETADLVVKAGPISAQRQASVDDDIDLARAGGHRGFDLADSSLQRTKPGRKTGGNGGYRDAAVLQGLDRRFDHAVVDADRAHGDIEPLRAQRLEDFLAQGPARFGAQPADPARRIVATQGRQIDAGHGLEQPGRLPVLLDRPAGSQSGGAALDGAAVDARIAQPREVERHTLVARGLALAGLPATCDDLQIAIHCGAPARRILLWLKFATGDNPTESRPQFLCD